jgi:ribose/xylose/arabinose/galactoside ABC-type transport system permease subunit
MTRFLPSRLFGCRTCGLVLLALAVSLLLGPAFWTAANLRSLFASIAVEGIMCVGMTVVMVAGGFDLSIGSVMALAGIIVVSAEAYGLGASAALALGAAAVVGIANGLLVAVLRINPFIATLATMIIVRALVLTWTGAEPVSGASPALMDAANGQVLGVPLAGLLLVALAALGHAFMARMRMGREIHALGGNEAAARASGVDTLRLKIFCYTVSGLCAGLAGIVLAGRLNTGSPIIGEQAALNVITAVLLGGTSLAGGVGTIWGSLAGLLTVGVIENVMRGADVPAYWQRILQGGLLLAIIVADRVLAKDPGAGAEAGRERGTPDPQGRTS